VAAVRGRVSHLPTAEELRRTPPAERLDALLPQLLRSVGAALGSQSAAIDPDLPLAGLGLDSLMAVELRNEIASRLDVSITIASFLSGATIRSVAQQVVAQLAAAETQTPPVTGEASNGDARAHGTAAASGGGAPGNDGDGPGGGSATARAAGGGIQRVQRAEDLLDALLRQVEHGTAAAGGAEGERA
jgi:acyl carrier protein